MRLGLRLLGIGFGGFLLWAALAPLDEGVPTSGQVVLDTKRKSIQHLSGGVVAEVLVKEGQFVKADQVLMKITDTATRAGFEAVRQRYLGLRAAEGRLIAERKGARTIEFHPDLLDARDNPLIQQHVDTQRQLLRYRQGALSSDIQALEEAIQAVEAGLKGNTGLLEARQSQVRLVREELESIREMVKEHYVPRTRQLELERNIAELTGLIADLQGSIQKAQKTIAEQKLRITQKKQEYQKEVETQLADIQREVQADAEKLKAAVEELSRTHIKSPTDGQVVGLTVQTIGAVVQPGQKLMDIVPQDEALLLETKVPPHLVDKVRPGMPVDVRFSTFAHSPLLVVSGKIDSISNDLITEPPPQNFSYYLTRVSVTPEGVKQLGQRTLQAGMPAEVIIRTGERTLLTYLLHPLSRRIAASLTEE